MYGNNQGRAQPGPSHTYEINQVQRQVDDVKHVMQENVEVMLANIDKTEVLEDKTAELAAQAKTFHKSSREVKRHFCKQNAKMNCLIGIVVIGVLMAIFIPVIVSVSQASDNGGGGDGGDSGGDGGTRRLLAQFFTPPELHWPAEQ